ncbi:MAG: hypothetical protein EVA88_02805, partial [Rhodospirillaceae bacterium]
MARRPRRNRVNIWPGFVDALTTLVMVVIFVLVVFIFAQQFLSTQLNDNVTQIRSLENENEQLEFEKFELQERNLRLGNELDAVLLELATLRGERNNLVDNLSASQDEVQALSGNVDDLRDEERTLLQRLAQSELENRQLRAENSKMADDMVLAQEVLEQAEAQRVALIQRVRDDGYLTEAMEETIAEADVNQERNLERFVTVRDAFLASIQNLAPSVADEDERELLLRLAERIPADPEADLGTVAPDRAARLKATVQTTQDLMEAMFALAEQKQSELNILLGTLIDARSQLSEAEQALVDDQIAMAQLRARNAEVSRDLVAANEAITVNEFTIEAKVAEIQVLTDVRDDLQSRVNGMQASILSFEEAISTLRASLGDRDRELADTVDNYEARIAELVLTLQAAEAQQATLQASLDARSEELETRAEQLDQVLLQLARGESDLQNLIEQRSVNQTELEKAIAQIAALDAQLTEQTNVLAAAELDISTSYARIESKD